MNNVSLCAKYHLCTSCGLCKNVCPNACIHYQRERGLFLPVIDDTKCTSCGICQKVCPGLKMTYCSGKQLLDHAVGDHLAAYNSWSTDAKLRFASASGGTLMSVVKFLLEEAEYDVAFCLDTYLYDQQVKTQKVTIDSFDGDWINRLPKSRYIPVSHENAVRYVREHKDQRVILIGTPCAVRGFKSFIEIFKLNVDHYLFLGLFCDSTFNYNIFDYFNETFGDHQLKKLHFKNKESGGWPGNMKLYINDEVRYVNQKERTDMKPYFMLERCLYCMDKLNTEADLSFGDNFTNKDSSKQGSNSIIIRTKKGQSVWDQVKNKLCYVDVDIDDIAEAQYLDGRLNHAYFAALKSRAINEAVHLDLSLNEGLILPDDPEVYRRGWNMRVQDLDAGARYLEEPSLLKKQIQKNKQRKNPHSIRSLSERFYFGIKRRMKKQIR